MMRIEECGVAILASGLSRRFGAGDKLLAPFKGAPLAAYAARTARSLSVKKRVAIAPGNKPEIAALFQKHEIDTIVNSNPSDGQGRSLAIAIEAIAAADCPAAFVLLADMPFIRPAHLLQLFSTLKDYDAAIACNGAVRTPPALFSARTFPALMALRGDIGAKGMLWQLDNIAETPIPRRDLLDIDAPADIAHAEAQ